MSTMTVGELRERLENHPAATRVYLSVGAEADTVRHDIYDNLCDLENANFNLTEEMINAITADVMATLSWLGLGNGSLTAVERTHSPSKQGVILKGHHE